MIVIADETKVVDMLGRFPLPVEIVSFGMEATRHAVKDCLARHGLRGNVNLRQTEDGEPFRTDGGNRILDASVGRIEDAKRLASDLSQIPGVVDHGLFVGIATSAIVAERGGIKQMTHR